MTGVHIALSASGPERRWTDLGRNSAGKSGARWSIRICWKKRSEREHKAALKSERAAHSVSGNFVSIYPEIR